MHVYGNIAHPGMVDRWPAPSVPTARIAPREPMAWPLPNLSTRVELPSPPVWAAPNPELLLSLSIAPLRFAPISWGPPVVVRSPWSPPAVASTLTDDASDVRRPARFGARRIWAYGLAASAAVVAVVAVAANL